MEFSNSTSQNDNFKLVYSPRTTYDFLTSSEDKLYFELLQSFNKKSLNILQRHFKEHLGAINKDLFICILKHHISFSVPEIKNKNKLLLKLLSKLFDDIDLDSNDIINWKEFSDYLVNFNGGKKLNNYFIKKYYQSKMNFSLNEKVEEDENFNFNKFKEEKVSYCFYIEKFRFLGLITEGSSKIIFFNTESNKCLKIGIDLSLIQKEIDKYILYELDDKIDNLLEKKEEEILRNKELFEEKRQILMSKKNKRYKSNSGEKSNNSYENKKIDIDNELIKNKMKKNKDGNKRLSTAISIKKKKIINIFSSKDINNLSNRPNKKSYYIASTLFLDEYNLLLISSTNNNISGWKYKEKEEYFENVNLINQNIENPFNKKKCIFEKNEILIPLFVTEYSQYSMCFDKSSNCLYTGQTDGKILKWDITINKPILILDINDFNEKNNLILPKLETSNNSKGDEIRDAILKKGQNDFNKIMKSFPENKRNTVSCLIFIEPLKILCSAHYNGLIILWDIVYNKPKRVYNDQKTGIYKILYNYNLNHIYSCGFDHDIYVYNPYIDHEAIYKLKGHKCSVNSIALNDLNNELISIDISGIIKIWDITNFFNFQTINTNDASLMKSNNVNEREELYNKIYKKKISANLHIQTFPDLSKFLIYGKKFLLFEKGNSNNPELCDDYTIIGCFYNPKKYNIVTISHKKIQFWNIFNGKLIKIFTDLFAEEKINSNNDTFDIEKRNINIDYEITAFSHDIYYKKLYLGNSLGQIKSFYLETGYFIKQYESHKTEITDIILPFKSNFLITCSIDLFIKFQKDSQQEEDKNNKSIREIELISQKNRKQFEEKINKISLRKIAVNEEKDILITCLSNGFINEYNIQHFKSINEFDCLNIRLDNLKNLSLIASAEYIKNFDLLCVILDNNFKKMIALKNNKFYNFLRGKNIGNFNDNIIANSKRHHFANDICNYYDIKTYKLFVGDFFGEITCYNLSILCKFFLDEKFIFNEENEKKINNANFDIIFKIKINNEPINYIFKPEILKPDCLIIMSLEKTAKLIDFNSGKFIDSLKQNSINEKPFPIAVKYSINTPFEKNNIISKNNQNSDENINKYSLTEPNKNEDNAENKIKKKYPYIIYRKNLKFNNESIKINDVHMKNELIKYSNIVLINSVKEKLRQPKFSKEIPEGKSTLWKYEINLSQVKKAEEENFSRLLEKIKIKDDEVNLTEKDFSKFNLEEKNYIPNYIKDLTPEKKEIMKLIVTKRINDVNLAYHKRANNENERKKVKKVEKNYNLSLINNLNSMPIKTDVNLFLTPIKPIKRNKSPRNKKIEKNELPIIPEIIKKNNQSIDIGKNSLNHIYKIGRNNKMNSQKTINKSPTKRILKNELLNIDKLSKEDKFKDYQFQFDEKMNEIRSKIDFIKLRKKLFKI